MLKVIGDFFGKLGRSLMLPVAVLPVAGILLRIGQPDVFNIPFIAAAGDAVFSNLPIIFAIGLAIGFAEDGHGSAALAAFVGHSVFISSLKILLPNANMGVLSGILIGVLSGILYNKYKDMSLPKYLSFFGGKRFVPILIGIISLLLAFIASFIWPSIEVVISSLGNWIIKSGNIGLFVYGFVNRLAIPLGLHHILNSLVWFQFGDYVVIEKGAEVIKHGDLWRFFAGDKTAGAFMAGFFPPMMFGLPGAALAMVLAARSEQRKATAGILISVALTSFIAGITEPIEFAFMFVAFPLYVLHAFLTGISFIIMNTLDVKLGFTFSAGAFDYILSYGLGRNGILLFPVGLVYAVVYFVVFYCSIKIWNLRTPGRGDNMDKDKIKLHSEEQGALYLTALGGKANIISLNHCTTRLRLEVKDNALVNEIILHQLGATAVVNKVAGSVQVIIGPEVEHLYQKIKNAISLAK